MIPPVANRFVAGETAPEALARARDLDERGVGTILNLLGEHYDRREPAEEDVAAYRRLLADLAASDARACVSVKPSQLGLDVGGDGGTPAERGHALFREHLEEVVAASRDGDAAADAGSEGTPFVWVDMEDHTTTDATLDAVEGVAREHGGGVGVCLQANLRRTPDDLSRLAETPASVRLVKGAYDEPADVAYQEKARVNEAYRELIGQAFREFDDGVAVATHDDAMIDHATRLHDEHGTDFEFQMLMGVREDLQFDLASEYDVWQYVPYGDRWLSYFYRRLAERKENVLFAARAILG